MADKGKHRVIMIPADNEIDSFVGGVQPKNNESPSDTCKPFNVGSWFSKMPMC